jgi:hypothetical protein
MDHVISADESEMIEIAIKTGLGRQNQGPVPLRKQGRNSPGCTRTPQSLQWRIRRHDPSRATGSKRPTRPRQKSRCTLDLHLSSSHDRSCHLPTRVRLLFLEMLLPYLYHDNCDPTCTLCSTDANACSPGPTSRTCSKDPKPWT